jgi:hypothetical protein
MQRTWFRNRIFGHTSFSAVFITERAVALEGQRLKTIRRNRLGNDPLHYASEMEPTIAQ